VLAISEFTNPHAGASKRGYTSKKRSEAAMIAAQNGICPISAFSVFTDSQGSSAQLLPVVSYAQVSSEKGKEKVAEGGTHFKYEIPVLRY
jgi:hypothetical protein